MDHKEQRQEGYYWVKFEGNYRIAWHSRNNYWLMEGVCEEMHDSDFSEIDENRIERPAARQSEIVVIADPMPNLKRLF